MKNKTINSIALVLYNLCFLSISYFIISIKPVSSLEVSIYGGIDKILWTIPLFCLICSSIFVISSIMDNKINANFFWIGLFLIILINSIIIILPLIKGYYGYFRADVLTHCGHIIDIGLKSHIDKNSRNIYPISHILAYFLSRLLNISYNSVIIFFPFFYSILYVLNIFVLAGQIFENKTYVKLSVLFSSVLLFSNYQTALIPQSFSMLMLPLFYYIYFNVKRNTVNFSLLFIIFSITFPFFHPLTTIIFILSLPIMNGLRYTYIQLCKNQTCSRFSYHSMLISSLVLLSWIEYNTWFWIARVEEFTTWISGNLTRSSEIQSSLATANKAQALGYNVYNLFFMTFWGQVIYLIITIFALFIIIKSVKKDPEVGKIYVLSGFFFLPLAIPLIIMAGINLFDFNIIRLIQVMVLITPIYVGFFFGKLFNSNSKTFKNFVFIIAICIFVSSAYAGVFNIHRSPYTLQSNDQFTKSEVNGISWFYKTKSANITFITLGTDPYRFADLLYGRATGRFSQYNNTQLPFPPHLGYYDNSSSLGQTLSNDAANLSQFLYNMEGDPYLILSARGEYFYKYILTNSPTLSADDLVKVESDTSLLKVYNNENIKIFIIRTNLKTQDRFHKSRILND